MPIITVVHKIAIAGVTTDIPKISEIILHFLSFDFLDRDSTLIYCMKQIL